MSMGLLAAGAVGRDEEAAQAELADLQEGVPQHSVLLRCGFPDISHDGVCSSLAQWAPQALAV